MASKYQFDLNRSYIVGDRMVDVEAGPAAGCRPVLVNEPSTTDFEALPQRRTFCLVEDRIGAVGQIVQRRP